MRGWDVLGWVRWRVCAVVLAVWDLVLLVLGLSDFVSSLDFLTFFPGFGMGRQIWKNKNIGLTVLVKRQL